MNADLLFSAGPDAPNRPLMAGLPAPEILAPADEQPDGRVILTDGGGRVMAHAALWWRETPPWNSRVVGTIGGFAAIDRDAALRVLEGAVAQLRKVGCDLAVGPMNGNTWRRHRFVTGSDGRGPFLLEPRNPVDWPGWWDAAGFGVLSRYSSSAMPLDGSETLPAAVTRRLERSGVTVRALDAARFEEELRRIHAISLEAFAGNFLYVPLEEEAFLATYQKVRSWIEPDFIRIAERDGRPCGFVFGIEDHEARARGEDPALIVKTLAVDPTAKCPGLGSLLVDELHRIGRQNGFTEAIHALQHEDNRSLKITDRHQGRAIRQYALYSKLL
jgi:GNAT superfamily N-acetyltransferase